MSGEEMSRWRVLEVHNFGGFFGGDTVTLTAARWDDHTEETLTIDEKALANVHDRYAIAPEMVLDLLMAGERVDRAELIGAADWELLDAALSAEAPQGPIHEPRIRAYHCDTCGLWILGSPVTGSNVARCRLCEALLNM